VNILVFTLLVACGSLAAGLVGSLTGLGGGVVIVPMLTLAFKVPIHYAMGASLVSVIATSSGAAATYVKEGYSNLRIGMFLEMATVAGALVGASLVHVVPTSAIAVTFGVVLIVSAAFSCRPHAERHATAEQPDRLATWLGMNGRYPTPQGLRSYCVYRVPLGFALMAVAGALSGLLGIGSGALKVVAMDQAMRIPFKVSTTTSNFMIGVTAAASAGLYLKAGYIDPGLAMPVILGVLPGAMLGAWLLSRLESRPLRWLFAAVIVVLAIEMIYNGAMGRL
jgi:uncharacterized membrane protein YfcA